MKFGFSRSTVFGRMVGLVLVVALASPAPARAQGSVLRPGDIVVVDSHAFGPPPPNPPDPAGAVIQVDPLTGAQTTAILRAGFSRLHPVDIQVR